MNMREVQVQQLLYDLGDFLSWWRRVPGYIIALIECVHNDVEFALPWKFKHALQASQQFGLTRLSRAMTMGQMEGRESLREFIGLIAELKEEGGQQIADVLIVGSTEIKVIKYKDC